MADHDGNATASHGRCQGLGQVAHAHVARLADDFVEGQAEAQQGNGTLYGSEQLGNRESAGCLAHATFLGCRGFWSAFRKMESVVGDERFIDAKGRLLEHYFWANR